MANKNFSSSIPSLLLLLVLVANLLVLLAPSVNSAHLPKKHEKCSVYRPNRSSVDGHRVKRVAGGSEGDIRQMPWMVYLTMNFTSANGHRTFDNACTGSLVSRRHVLTAAHCVPLARMPNSSYMVTAHFGSANKSASRRAISVTTASIHVDPEMSSFRVNNSASLSGFISIIPHDAALIDLGQDLELDETVRPICVACLDNQTFPQGQAYIAGWGNIKPSCTSEAEWPDVFKYGTVGVHQCLTPGFLAADKVCTQKDDQTHGYNGGDSGGPVLASADNGKTFLQVGVISNSNCQLNEREDGASKIAKQWFEQITGVKCKKFRVNNKNNNDSDCEDDE